MSAAASCGKMSKMDRQSAADSAANQLYYEALRRGFWRRLASSIRRSCNDLLPAGQVLQALDLRTARSRGLQEVALDHIVGSTGRSHEFDLALRPRRFSPDGRWSRVARAALSGKHLPPVRLYKLGQVYLVEDGNHRISVARALGRKTIPATVYELDPSPLQAEASCKRLGYRWKGGNCGGSA